jgi:hypothetical protein
MGTASEVGENNLVILAILDSRQSTEIKMEVSL